MSAGAAKAGFRARLSRRGPGSRAAIGLEIALVLALSLGRSGVYAVLNLIGRLADPAPLAQQVAELNPSRATLPALDLAYQMAYIFFGLVPVALAWYLLSLRGPLGQGRGSGQSDSRSLDSSPVLLDSSTASLDGRPVMLGGSSVAAATGVDWGWRRPRHDDEAGLRGRRAARVGRDWAWGFGLAAAVGVPGLGLYLAGRALGLTVAIQASGLGEHWWTVPVLLLSAFQNAALEEFIVVAYLFERVSDWRGGLGPGGLGSGGFGAGGLAAQGPDAGGRGFKGMGAPGAGVAGLGAGGLDWGLIWLSALIRGSYHLYQGIGPFFGNVAMGLLFAAWFQSRFGRRRVLPLVIAHTLLDVVAFVGYALAPATLLQWLGF